MDVSSSRPGLWVMTSVALLAAGVALAGSAWLQWAPCFGSGAGNRCIDLMSESGSLPLLGSPGFREPGTEILAAIGSLLLAVAWFLVVLGLPAHLRRGPWVWLAGLPAISAGAVILLDYVVPGAPELLLDSLLFYLLTEIIVAFSVLLVWESVEQRDHARLVIAAFAVSSFGVLHVFPDNVVAQMFWPSADAAPGTGLVTAGGIALAGLLIVALTIRRSRRRPAAPSPVVEEPALV